MLQIALRNCFRARVRTFLTILGIGVVLCLFVTLNTIGNQFAKKLDHTLAAQIDVIVQAKNAGTPFSSYVDQEVAQQLTALSGVTSSASFIMASRKIHGSSPLYLFGTSDFNPIASRLGLGLVEGRKFTSGRNEILLGQKAARRLGLSVGDNLSLDTERAFIISGIYSLGIDYLDGGVFLDIKQAQKILNQDKVVNLVFLTLAHSALMNEVVDEINRHYPKLLAYPSGELSQNVSALRMVNVLVYAISFVTLLVSCLVVLNTLVMALSERTKEIGILMAVGWPRKRIMMTIIIESTLITLLASGLGYLFSYPLLALMNFLPSVGPSWLPDAPEGIFLFHTLAIGALMGIISAIYPALFATRLLPAKALRYG